MPNFVLIYKGGNPPATPEEGQANMAKWFEWTKAAGDKMVEPNNPLVQWKSVGPDGTVSDMAGPFMGYSVISVETQDEALALAKACPFLEVGGTIDVAQIMEMPGK
ncbi:MAG TPA: YciI family protein [Paracoccaceae bacterium]|nr:YciI family protein [Paracoccaceae bacterium]